MPERICNLGPNLGRPVVRGLGFRAQGGFGFKGLRFKGFKGLGFKGLGLKGFRV